MDKSETKIAERANELMMMLTRVVLIFCYIAGAAVFFAGVYVAYLYFQKNHSS